MKKREAHSRAAMLMMRDEMDVMCCKSVGTDLSMLDIDDLMTEISQLKKEVALLESKLRERDQLNTKCCCNSESTSTQTSTGLLVSVCNDEDQKTSVNLLDCGMKVKQEVTEEQIDEGDLNYSVLIVKEESSQLRIMEEKPHHFIPNEESLSCLMTEKNLSPKKSNKQKKTPRDPFMCPQCGKIFAFKYILKRHMIIHTREKPYRCDQCGNFFKSKYYLNLHMRRLHTVEKPYRCDQCGKSFIRKGELTIHMRLHTGEKPYSCDQCGKSFICKAELTRHMRHHTGETPYRCDQCGKNFTRKFSLNLHMTDHTGETPFRCGWCGKGFKEKYYLNMHIMRHHTGEKPYRCDHCEKSFIRKSCLNVHMKIHTGESLTDQY